MKWPGATMKAEMDVQASTSGKESFVVGMGQRQQEGGKGHGGHVSYSNENQEFVSKQGQHSAASKNLEIQGEGTRSREDFWESDYFKTLRLLFKKKILG